MTKRICLLVGFHPKNQISDYVVHYARALAEVADVYYMADCEMPATELEKLAPYTKGAWGYRHRKYDFGSWQELIQKLGWDTITQYDECIFANDSVFAPIFPLKPIMENGTRSSADSWALNSFDKICFVSSFYVLKKPVLLHPDIQTFFNNIQPQPSVEKAIDLYEKNLPRVIQGANFSCKVLIDWDQGVYSYWREFVLLGHPALKVAVFTRTCNEPEWASDWRAFLRKNTDYPISLIEQHLRSLDIDPDSFNSLGKKIASYWIKVRRIRQKMFRIRFHKGENIILLFGVTLYSSKENNLDKKAVLEKL